MDVPDKLFSRLAESPFRSSFNLSSRKKELLYLRKQGMEIIMQHARAFLTERIAPGNIDNDGRQTPMKNHPVFIAQHATATCCRKCIEKWHGIKKGKDLSGEELEYLLKVIETWLSGFI